MANEVVTIDGTTLDSVLDFEGAMPDPRLTDLIPMFRKDANSDIVAQGEMSVQEIIDGFGADAEGKIAQFNANATEKTNSFNSNASQKTSDLDAYAEALKPSLQDYVDAAAEQFRLAKEKAEAADGFAEEAGAIRDGLKMSTSAYDAL